MVFSLKSIILVMGSIVGTAYAQSAYDLPTCPIPFLTDGIVASDGSIWVTGERSGVYKLSLDENKNGEWINTNYYAGFPKTQNFYTIAEDLQGRIWVGTDNQGVIVFNGENWKSYTKENALCGERVFDIAVSPTSGEVAISTSGGVTIYNPANEHWRDLNRHDGLLADQVEALSFDSEGKLWLAYTCGGVASSSSKSGYSKWENVQAPWYWDAKQYIRQPFSGKGEGLPSNLGNAILAKGNGNVWLGTTCGLASNFPTGRWQYIRGKDYEAKNKGVYGGGKASSRKYGKNDLLPEDYITCLCETPEGIWVGTRTKGAALVDKKTLKILKTENLIPKQKYDQQTFPSEWEKLPAQWITAFLPLQDGSVYAATYGRGLVNITKGNLTWKKKKANERDFPNHPSYPQPLNQEKLIEEIVNLGKYRGNNKNSPALFWKEDWATQGRWCERYGRDFAVLCAAGNIPRDLSMTLEDLSSQIMVAGRIGCHSSPNDSLRHWIHNHNMAGNPNVLHNLSYYSKTEAEWDDHGEAYPRTFDGPDVWAIIKVPEGKHQISLYFYNPNGLEQANAAQRDYLVEVRKFQSKYPDELALSPNLIDPKQNRVPLNFDQKETADILKTPVLTRFRVKSFAGSGVYKTILVKEKGYYFIRIGKNYSFNTLLNGIFITKLEEKDGTPPTRKSMLFEYAGKCPQPCPITDQDAKAHALFLEYWSKLTAPHFSPSYLSKAHQLALQIYRIIQHTAPNSSLIPNWRWTLNMWNEQETDKFEQLMLEIWYQKQEKFPDPYASKKFFPFSPRTIPFAPLEIRIMRYMDIDWHQYLPNYQGIPKPSAEKFHQLIKNMTEQEYKKLAQKYTEKRLMKLKQQIRKENE